MEWQQFGEKRKNSDYSEAPKEKMRTLFSKSFGRYLDRCTAGGRGDYVRRINQETAEIRLQ